MKTCQHIRQAVPIGNHTVYATAGRSVANQYRPLEFGVFLDKPLWTRLLQVPYLSSRKAHSKLPKLPTNDSDVIIIDWPDFGVIGQDRFSRLIKIILREVKQKTKVEIGCIGGHGRTGTVLAGLLIEEEGLNADVAIKTIRHRYCPHAVETADQIKMLHLFASSRLGFHSVNEFDKHDSLKNTKPYDTGRINRLRNSKNKFPTRLMNKILRELTS